MNSHSGPNSAGPLLPDEPLCWLEVEARFPQLSEQEAARYWSGAAVDPDKSLLYETLFSLYPGLLATFSRSPSAPSSETVSLRGTEGTQAIGGGPDALSLALAHLSADDQQWVVWREMERLTPAEIAERVGWDEAAAAERCREVGDRLMEALAVVSEPMHGPGE